jgi:hypothetical protein
LGVIPAKAGSGIFYKISGVSPGFDPGFVGVKKLGDLKKAQTDYSILSTNGQVRYLSYFTTLKNLQEPCYAEFIHSHSGL